MWQSGDPIAYQEWNKGDSGREMVLQTHTHWLTSKENRRVVYELQVTYDGCHFVKRKSTFVCQRLSRPLFAATHMAPNVSTTKHCTMLRVLGMVSPQCAAAEMALNTSSPQHCTVMLFHDMISPQWTEIRCTDKYFRKILCSLPKHKNNTLFPTKGQLAFCQKDHISKNGSCYNFEWLWLPLSEKHSCVSVKKMLFVFTAAAFTPFAVISNTGSPLMIERYHDVIILKKSKFSKTSKGICTKKSTSVSFVVAEHVFPCSSGTYMSPLYVCDGKKDCPTETPADESNCKCNPTETMTKTCQYFVGTSSDPICSPLFNKTNKNKCIVYSSTMQSAAIKDSSEIILSGQNPECCLSISELPCTEADCNCYSFSQVCMYNLNKSGQLVPCEHGEHLQQCKEFDCSVLFDCPGFYCLPWKFVCDGNWDCPGGYDESEKHRCGPNRVCTNLFICRGHSICVHVASICDGISDCPKSDDEYFCTLRNVVCPERCVCLTDAVMCTNISIDTSFLRVPFKAIYVLQSRVDVKGLLGAFHTISVTQSNVTSVRQLFPAITSVSIVNIANNALSHLSCKCFNNMWSLKAADISNNRIDHLGPHVFVSLPLLLYLNLSSNPLSVIDDAAFENLPQLHLISMLNINVSKASEQIFLEVNVKLLEVSRHEMCCLVQSETSCSTPPDWFFSCTDILTSTPIKVTFYIDVFCHLWSKYYVINFAKDTTLKNFRGNKFFCHFYSCHQHM